MQHHCAYSLRDRGSEITFLSEQSLWIGGKERKKERKKEQEIENSFLPLNTKPEHSVKRARGGRKRMLGRNDTSVWPSLPRQVHKQRPDKGIPAASRTRVGLHGLSQRILMTPAHPEALRTGRLLFQSAETPQPLLPPSHPKSTRAVIWPQRREGERVSMLPSMGCQA